MEPSEISYTSVLPPGVSLRHKKSLRRKKRSPYDRPRPGSAGKDPLPLILEADDSSSSDSECEEALPCYELEDLRIIWKREIQEFMRQDSFSSTSRSSQRDDKRDYLRDCLTVRASRPQTKFPSPESLFDKTFFDIERKIRLSKQVPHGSGFSYLNNSLELRCTLSTEALDSSIASTVLLRRQLYRERRYLEAATLSVHLLQHRVLILPPLLDFVSRRDMALRSFPHDVAGKWCFGADDILMFPGFHADASVLNFVLKEVVTSLVYLNDVEEPPQCTKIEEYNEKTLSAVNRNAISVCPSLYTPGIPKLDRIFKPVFTKRYFLLSAKQRIAAELVHIAALALHRLTEWALHEGEYGIALAFAQHQHIAELCLRNYYPEPERLRPYYLHTMTMWALGRAYSAIYDQFEEKSQLIESFAYATENLQEVSSGLRSLHDDFFEQEGRFPESPDECLAIAGSFYRLVRVPATWQWYNNQRNLTTCIHLSARLSAWMASIFPAGKNGLKQRKSTTELLREMESILQHALMLSYELAYRNTVHEIVVRCLAARAARYKQQWSLCGATVQQDERYKHCIVAPQVPSFAGMQQRRDSHKAALLYAQQPLLPHLVTPLMARLARRVLADAVMDCISALECKRNPQWIVLVLKTFIPLAQTWHPPHKKPTEKEAANCGPIITSHEFDGFQFESESSLELEQKEAFYSSMALLLYGLGVSFTLLAETVVKVRAAEAAQRNAHYAFTVAAPLLRKRHIVASIVETFVEEAKLYQLFSVDYRRSSECCETNETKKDSETTADHACLDSKAVHVKERLAGVFTTMRKLTYLLPLLYEYCITIKTVLGPKNYPLRHVTNQAYVLPLKIFPFKSTVLANETEKKAEAQAQAEMFAVENALKFLMDSLGLKEGVKFSGLQTTDCPDSSQVASPINFDTSIFSLFSSTDDVLSLSDDGEEANEVKERPMVYGKDFGVKCGVLNEGSPLFPLEDHYAKDQINYCEFEGYTEDQYDKIFSNFERDEFEKEDPKLEHHLAKLKQMLALLTQTAVMDLKFLREHPQFCQKVKFLHLKGDGYKASEYSVASLMIELSLLYQRFVDPDDYIVLLITSALHKVDSIVNAGRMVRALRGEFTV